MWLGLLAGVVAAACSLGSLMGGLAWAACRDGARWLGFLAGLGAPDLRPASDSRSVSCPGCILHPGGSVNSIAANAPDLFLLPVGHVGKREDMPIW